MNDAEVVKVSNAPQRLLAHRGNLGLCHHVRRHHVCQRTAFHVFHDDPEFALDQEGVDEVDNVLVLGFAHDENLVDDELLFGLLGEVHLFDGDRDIGVDGLRSVHTARGTNASR